MSLINQMLKDIDKRQGVHATTFADSAGLRLDVPRQAATSPTKRALLGGGLAVVLVAAGVYGIRQWSAPAAPQILAVAPAPVVVAPAPVAVPTPAPTPVAVEPVKTVQAPSPVGGGALAPAARPAESERKPERKPEPAPVQEPVKALAPAVPLPPEPVAKTAPRKDAPVPAVAALGTVSRQLSVEQRADNAYREAVTLLRQGRSADAQKLLHSSLADWSGHQEARLLLARVLVDEGRLGEAKTVLAEGVTLRPQTFQFHSALAQAQLMGKEIDAAVLTLERGLPAAGDNPEYQALMAAALQQQARHSEAVQHYVTALRQLPDTPNWLVGLGVSLQAMNNLNGAAEAYQRALDLGLPASLGQFAREKLSQLKR